jgi:hypothetical protein
VSSLQLLRCQLHHPVSGAALEYTNFPPPCREEVPVVSRQCSVISSQSSVPRTHQGALTKEHSALSTQH